MARSLASSKLRTAAAAAGYAAFWGALVALAAPAPLPRVNVVRTVASHSPGEDPGWRMAYRVYDEVERRTRRLGRSQRTVVARAILEEAARAAMDPLLVLAIIQVESSFDVRAVSGAGAVGLMQLRGSTMREEASRSGLASADPLDPVANVRAGVRYLDRLVGAFDDVELALMAYNAGPNRIRRHLRAGGIPRRFFAYPRSIGRELALLSATDEEARRRHAAPRGAARVRLAAAHAPLRREAPAATRHAVTADTSDGPDGPVRPTAPAVTALAGAAATDRKIARVRRARWPSGGSSARRPRSRSSARGPGPPPGRRPSRTRRRRSCACGA